MSDNSSELSVDLVTLLTLFFEGRILKQKQNLKHRFTYFFLTYFFVSYHITMSTNIDVYSVTFLRLYFSSLNHL